MLVLGIETSCDETSCAVVEEGGKILSNVIASQVKSHKPYGGVVPELASRLHIKNCIPILEAAMSEAKISLKDIDLIGVTNGPGLIGSLLVGVELAKALSYVLKKPLVPVHHIAAHLYSPFLKVKDEEAKGDDFGYPYLGLVVSGGHSSLIYVKEPLKYEVLGRTLDDAAGEAFDKVAKLLGLGYPGGPIIDKLSEEGDPGFYDFPRPGIRADNNDLSFSGLKTAVVRFVQKWKKENKRLKREDLVNIAASFQAAVIDTLLAKTQRALSQSKSPRLVIVGGVACNKALRREAITRFPDVQIGIPTPVLCTDNAAMIAGLAPFLEKAGVTAPLTLNADANLKL